MTHTMEFDPGFSTSTEPLFTATSVIDHRGQTVHLAGELDLDGHAVATAMLGDAHRLPITVDMTDLHFMDCGGYRSIATARRTAEQHGVTLTVANAHGEPARLLGLLAELGLL